MFFFAIAYFCSSGSIFSIGDFVTGGGGTMSFIASFLAPFVYSVPLLLMCLELSTHFPLSGGTVDWAFALGTAASFVHANLRFVTNLFDAAIYSAFTADSAGREIPQMMYATEYRLLVFVLTRMIILGLNFVGLNIVGFVAFAFVVLILMPFVLLFFFEIGRTSSARVFAGPASPDYRLFFASVIWQYSGADTAAALAAAVENPRRALGVGLAVSQTVIGISNVLGVVLAASLGAGRDFGVASLQIPMCENGWLSVWIRIAAAAGGLAANVAAVAAAAQETAAAGAAGFLPFGEILRRRDASFGDEAILLVAVAVVTILSLPISLVSFDRLVEWAAAFRALQGLVVCAMFVALRLPARAEIVRRRLPKGDAVGPGFTIPGGWIGAVVVVALLAAACVTAIVFIGRMVLATAVAMVAGMALLKPAELGVLSLIDWVKTKRAERRAATGKAESDQPAGGEVRSSRPTRGSEEEEESVLFTDLDDDE
jgi:hypothetical protein